MMRNSFLKTKWRLKRIMHSMKKAVFYLGFFVISMASVCGLCGVLKVPRPEMYGPAGGSLPGSLSGRTMRAELLFSGIHSR
jgi:hypothetical protein